MKAWKFGVLILPLGLLCSFALAQEPGHPGPGPSPSPSASPSPAPTAKPEVEAILPSSPPLETDDPGIPDRGELEVNVITESGKGYVSVIIDSNLGAKLPLLGDVQLTVGLTRTQLTELGFTAFEGVEFRVKKILTKQGKLVIALFPALGLPASQEARDHGIGEKLFVKIPLLFSEDLGHGWAAVENIGYQWHQEGGNLGTGAAGLAYTIKDGFAVMGDGYFETPLRQPFGKETTRGVEGGFTHTLIKNRLSLQGSVGYEWTPEGSAPKARIILQWNGSLKRKSKGALDAESRQDELDAREKLLEEARARNNARAQPNS